MICKKIECPICGNEVSAKSIKAKQMCNFCKRHYKISIEFKSNKKHVWNASPSKSDRPSSIEYLLMNDMRLAHIDDPLQDSF